MYNEKNSCLENFLNTISQKKEEVCMAFADTFKALSDPVRREILTMLKNERMPAGEIAAHFDMTGATVSYHLSILKKADLVYEEKEKQFIYYNLNTSILEEVILWLSNLKGDDDNETEN